MACLATTQKPRRSGPNPHPNPQAEQDWTHPEAEKEWTNPNPVWRETGSVHVGTRRNSQEPVETCRKPSGPFGKGPNPTDPSNEGGTVPVAFVDGRVRVVGRQDGAGQKKTWRIEFGNVARVRRRCDRSGSNARRNGLCQVASRSQKFGHRETLRLGRRAF